MSITKFLDFPSISEEGEPLVHLVTPDFKNSLVKTASGLAWSPKIKEFIDSATPEDGKTLVLINALGAGEFYGANINGDYFPEEALKKYHHTFVEGGHPFVHHKNSDPEASFGDILLSDYNDLMHRVELIVGYDLGKLDSKYINKINNRELLNTSMGCKVPYDICSLCSHIAKSPKDYCDCLKKDPGLGKWTKDGRKASAVNTKPRFFDISIVSIPADSTSRVLLKVANRRSFYMGPSYKRAEEILGEECEDKQVELPEIGKEQFMETIEDLIGDFDRFLGDDLPDQTLNRMGGSSPNPLSLLKGLLNSGTFLRPREAQRVILVSSGKKDLADQLDSNKIVVKGNPSKDILSRILNSEADDSAVNCMHSQMRDSREMSPKRIKITIIKMMSKPFLKEAGLLPVSISDDFRLLNGEQTHEELSMLDNPIGTVKTLLALGALIAAFQQASSTNLMSKFPVAAPIAGLLASAQIASMASDFDERINAPSQEMRYLSDRDMPGAEEALLSTIFANKEASAAPLGLELKHLLSIPLAYGAAQVLSNTAKKHEVDEYHRTGKYNESWLKNPAANFAVALPMFLKLSTAKGKVNKFMKTAQSKFGSKFNSYMKNNWEDVSEILQKLIFKLD